MESALGRPKAKTAPAYKVRQQVLARENLLDVFNYVDRRTLDVANVVSATYNATAQRAQPLRSVKSAHLLFRTGYQKFHVAVVYNRGYVRGDEELKMSTDNMEEAVRAFFRFLRFCNVSGRVQLLNLQIPQLFVHQLKAVAMEFLCKDTNLELDHVTLADGVDVIELLLAFPSFRELNSDTNFLIEGEENGDELLKSAASRGAFYLFADWPFPTDHQFSEAAILDYTFGDYNDNGKVRKLELPYPVVSRKLLVNLVQACRERRSELKVDLTLLEICEDLDVDELAANGEKHPSDSRVVESYVWLFRFDDLPELSIEYKAYHHAKPSNREWENAELRCWGTIRGSGRGL